MDEKLNGRETWIDFCLLFDELHLIRRISSVCLWHRRPAISPMPGTSLGLPFV